MPHHQLHYFRTCPGASRLTAVVFAQDLWTWPVAILQESIPSVIAHTCCTSSSFTVHAPGAHAYRSPCSHTGQGIIYTCAGFPDTVDTLPEWSKGVDSSSTSASCVGSNLTVVTAGAHLSTHQPLPQPHMAALHKTGGRPGHTAIGRPQVVQGSAWDDHTTA